jgi:DNA-binding HxlR family transcriptional regulator
MIEDKQIIDFLQRKGALEILVEIGYKPKRHTDLREKLLMSSSTIHERLTTGMQLELWKQSLEQQSSGVSAKVYELTELGREVWDAAKDEDLRRYHMSRRDAVRYVRNAENAVLREVSPQDAEWWDEIDSEIEIERFETQTRLDEFFTD